VWRPLSPLFQPARPLRVFSSQAASIIADILSDPGARSLEFGTGSLLTFPVQTAVKTGTSSDHRDTWALGFTREFTAGVWMGNLDALPTRGLTGSQGPALVLRGIMAFLNSLRETAPLAMSPGLLASDVRIPRLPGVNAPPALVTEWFIPGTEPGIPGQDAAPESLVRDAGNGPPAQGGTLPSPPEEAFGFVIPTEGMAMAMDPRIPDRLEGIDLVLSGVGPKERVSWSIDGLPAGTTQGGRLPWTLRPGRHRVEAELLRGDDGELLFAGVRFTVR
jgi:penicillin-binding protein 1C